MKRIIAFATLAALMGVAGCGTTTDEVTRSEAAPLGIFGIKPDHSGATSTRSSIDLLSLT
ncbi:hypothetical protein [uncultured Tateyamaria sp.]|uniref:hypothetical protein n=1 Tax=uncultured Tateyamaria sp. TaxID=455651 RepID=UPI00263246F2|nr:hypothetical protein [uncultured Tateyamaria sp.]